MGTERAGSPVGARVEVRPDAGLSANERALIARRRAEIDLSGLPGEGAGAPV